MTKLSDYVKIAEAAAGRLAEHATVVGRRREGEGSPQSGQRLFKRNELGAFLKKVERPATTNA